MNTRAKRSDSPLLELLEHRKPRSDKGTVRIQKERKFVSPDSDFLACLKYSGMDAAQTPQSVIQKGAISRLKNIFDTNTKNRASTESEGTGAGTAGTVGAQDVEPYIEPQILVQGAVGGQENPDRISVIEEESDDDVDDEDEQDDNDNDGKGTDRVPPTDDRPTGNRQSSNGPGGGGMAVAALIIQAILDILQVRTTIADIMAEDVAKTNLTLVLLGIRPLTALPTVTTTMNLECLKFLRISRSL
jgi:hypothetical protein